MAKVLNQDLASTMEGQQVRLGKIQSLACDRVFLTSNAVIGSSSPAKIKTTNTIYPFVNGSFVAGVTTAETVLPAGTVLNGQYQAYFLVYDTTNGLSVLAGTPGASLAAVVCPTIPANTVVVGVCTIHPTGAGSFVAGTTSLSDGTVVPNAVFFDTGHFNPNMLTL